MLMFMMVERKRNFLKLFLKNVYNNYQIKITNHEKTIYTCISIRLIDGM